MQDFDLSLPLQQQISELYRKKVYRPWIRSIRMKDFGWDGISDVPDYLRAISWQDGACGQLNYLCRDDVLAAEELLKISVNKHSAARSGMEQACDVAPIFRRLKELIKKLMFETKTRQQCWRTRHIHDKMSALPLNLPSWKKNIIVDVVRCFPDLVREACTIANVRRGFTGNGQICSHENPVPDFLNCLATRRVPYFETGTTMEEKKIHCRQLMDWFGPISLAVGCIDEETFSEHGIKLDYNEDGIAVQKTATLTCEGQQRAKHLSNIQTRYARQMISYERVFEQYTKICKTKQDETNLLTRGVEAEQKILMCIGLVLNTTTPTLDDMTLATLGERGGIGMVLHIRKMLISLTSLEPDIREQ